MAKSETIDDRPARFMILPSANPWGANNQAGAAIPSRRCAGQHDVVGEAPATARIAQPQVRVIPVVNRRDRARFAVSPVRDRHVAGGRHASVDAASRRRARRAATLRGPRHRLRTGARAIAMQPRVGREQLDVSRRRDAAGTSMPTASASRASSRFVAPSADCATPEMRARRGAQRREVHSIGRRDARVEHDAPSAGCIAPPHGEKHAMAHPRRDAPCSTAYRTGRVAEVAASRDARLRRCPFEPQAPRVRRRGPGAGGLRAGARAAGSKAMPSAAKLARNASRIPRSKAMRAKESSASTSERERDLVGVVRVRKLRRSPRSIAMRAAIAIDDRIRGDGMKRISSQYNHWLLHDVHASVHVFTRAVRHDRSALHPCNRPDAARHRREDAACRGSARRWRLRRSRRWCCRRRAVPSRRRSRPRRGC